MRKSIISISFLIYIFCFLPYSKSMAYEESQYDVVYKSEIYEVRHYKERLIVEVVSRNDDSSFRKEFTCTLENSADFRKLAPAANNALAGPGAHHLASNQGYKRIRILSVFVSVFLG